MTAIHVLFLGVIDAHLLTTLWAEGLKVEAEGAELEEIWSTNRRGRETGFRYTGRMRELISAAKSGRYDYVIMPYNRHFTPTLLSRIGKRSLYYLADSLIVEFAGAIPKEPHAELSDRGIRNFTSRTLIAHQTAGFILEQEQGRDSLDH